MTATPLIQPTEGAIAWRGGEPISRALLNKDLVRLQSRLEETEGAVLNLCEDHYHFLLAFFAAASCGRINLLPHNRSEHAIAELKQRYPHTQCLDDAQIQAWLARPQAERPLRKAPDPQRPVAIVFTSGSTGQPSAHPKTWQALTTGSALLRQRLREDYGLADCALVATVPPQHMYGLETTVLLPALGAGSIHCERPFFPADVRAALTGLPSPRALITTPVHLRKLLQADIAWPPLEFVLSATAPLPADLARQAEATMATRVVEIYGSSETGAMATRRPAREEYWQPLTGVAVQQDSAQGASIRAPQLDQPMALTDILQVNEDGRFRLLGRDADMIKIAGKRASLADLSAKLLAIDGVMDGIIILPDENPERVTRLAAAVVAPDLSVAHIRQALAKAVDPVFLPRPIHKLERLPRTEMGKLSRDGVTALMRQLEKKTCE